MKGYRLHQKPAVIFPASVPVNVLVVTNFINIYSGFNGLVPGLH